MSNSKLEQVRPTFHLIATTFNRQVELAQFLNALISQIGRPIIKLYLLDQNPHRLDLDKFEFGPNIKVIYVHEGARLGLSAARNKLISYLDDVNGGDIIAFPDDDCWYPENLLADIEHVFNQTSVDLICTHVYDPINEKDYGGRPSNKLIRLTFSNLFSLPISVGIFMKFDQRFISEMRFDNNLGAGTKLGSGEETDFVYRLLKAGARGIYDGNYRVYHLVEPADVRDEKKAYAYGLGFGFIASRFVIRGNWIIISSMIDIMMRSCAGYLISMNKRTARRYYSARLTGIVRGISMAFKTIAER
ncbi:MAG: hypothetical protein C0464_03585 [Cyanobacteria bacterium DS2.008]|uniref:glycosyltransferase family 2 protein n=1 Tax=Blastomonas sp. TaxID=1909299 RepID=UPI0017F08A43|nr:hypothetical protein [Cyanobacteria bacterium DS2.008]MBA4781360.1 glycosyltransferase [Blastomonas sp.]